MRRRVAARAAPRTAPRTAIVADYLNQRGGAEWVVAVLHEMFPEAPVFTTILDRERLWPALRQARIVPSWMQRLPGLSRHFKKYLPFYYLAIERLDLTGFDLVISSSCAFGLGARAEPGALHVCYCHTPARFLWEHDRYMEKEGVHPAVRRVLSTAIAGVRRWDRVMARRPHHYVANSTAVAERIRRYYGRDATVIPPPVDVDRFSVGERPEAYYLVVSRLNAYKRIDLAVRAFSAAKRRLVVVGEGPQRPALERLAGPTIHFTGWLPDGDVARLYRSCRALVIPGEEDFGIAAVEAGASGRPVVAYRGGGALDTVVEGVTGLFFPEPTPEALNAAIEQLEHRAWSPRAIRARAERFGVEAFKARFGAFLAEKHRLWTGQGAAIPA
jgi:glycosyltransferase involved in cell wall biosynthesis